MSIAFTPRDTILDPIAVVGLGDAARALAHRLLELEDGRLRELRGAAGEGILIALGETAALPWAAGVTYLGHESDAPRLLVPTMIRPAIAFDVFERAIARHAAPLSAPWAVLASPARVFSVANATTIDRNEILRWLEEMP
jgi:MoxR-vWA-beta-propeller ternary system domain bpX5